jgi:large subunit ribosomal protein L23
MEALDLLRRPVITEKSSLLQERGRYVFEVAPSANKLRVKEAVEKAFNVHVVGVNISNVHGKLKRFGTRIAPQSSWKKAVVTLKPGERIEIFEGA